jgi:uncharacterized coiled-coil protein SlyX
MDITKIKLPIAVIGVILAQAFGIIWYVAQLDSTVSNLDTTVTEMQSSMTDTSIAVIETDLNNLKEQLEGFNPEADLESVWEAIDDLDNRIDDLETKDAIIENEMRTIMSDHMGFNQVLKDLGKDGYGDNREYGDYKE